MSTGPASPWGGQCFSPQRSTWGGSECHEEETHPQKTNPIFSSALNGSRQRQNRSMLLAPQCPDLTTVWVGPGDVTQCRQALGTWPQCRRALGMWPQCRQALRTWPQGSQALGTWPQGSQALGTWPQCRQALGQELFR